MIEPDESSRELKLFTRHTHTHVFSATYNLQGYKAIRGDSLSGLSTVAARREFREKPTETIRFINKSLSMLFRA